MENYKFFRVEKTKLILITAVIIFSVFIVFILFSFLPTQQSPEPLAPTPKLSPEYMSPLTSEEEAYPEAPPQPLPSINDQVGILVVTSPQTDVRIVLDPPEEEVADSASAQRIMVIAPFKMITIPVGLHTITAAKPGYTLISKQFQIEPNKVTRVVLNLELLPTHGAYYPPE